MDANPDVLWASYLAQIIWLRIVYIRPQCGRWTITYSSQTCLYLARDKQQHVTEWNLVYL